MTRPAVRELDRLAEAARAAVMETLASIERNPFQVGKPLRFELEGLRSARRGPYRVIYRIDDEQGRIVVVAVGHRSDVYRRRDWR